MRKLERFEREDEWASKQEVQSDDRGDLSVCFLNSLREAVLYVGLLWNSRHHGGGATCWGSKLTFYFLSLIPFFFFLSSHFLY
ncbi:hypothetical protein Sjap_015694 [Stephania japonica]|uniref:Uncharacterized protein n=1 Tax=Stephania japonica TaxID=461633 RepID=A0AAP0ILJ4_9MAGN